MNVANPEYTFIRLARKRMGLTEQNRQRLVGTSLRHGASSSVQSGKHE